MNLGVRVAAVGAGALVAACALSSCASSPTAGQKNAVRNILTTTTTAPTTSASSTTTTLAGVAVPDVIGFKIGAARTALRAIGLFTVPLNAACNKGTLASQSVVTSLSVPGKSPDPRVGAVPLAPGAVVAPGTRVGITWSGCYGDASTIPAVVGLTFASAKEALHAVGLTWACYSVGRAATTTTTTAPDSSTTSSTAAAVTTTTVRPPGMVLTQSPGAGTVLKPGATVTITMHECPQ
jgi:beta-lactam-binding protein with PASTA domain